MYQDILYWRFKNHLKIPSCPTGWGKMGNTMGQDGKFEKNASLDHLHKEQHINICGELLPIKIAYIQVKLFSAIMLQEYFMSLVPITDFSLKFGQGNVSHLGPLIILKLPLSSFC